VQTPNGLQELEQAFGDIGPYIAADGTLALEWQNQQLARAILPFSLPLDWNRSVSVNLVLCHKKLVGVFETIFQQIMSQGLQDKIKTYGGCFAYRPQRGGTKLSTHAWGIAIDLNCFENEQGTSGNMDAGVIKVFQDNGFFWGGNFGGTRTDPMHFQFATGY
jgi:D-alanyl-D-alanine carboxypeptidase